jgi:CBS domain-containing protein
LPEAFDFSKPPFNRLTIEQSRQVRRAVDIAFFRSGQRVIKAGETPDHLHVVIKGFVEERDGDEVVAVYGPDDAFDTRALIGESSGLDFVVTEESLCYLLPQELMVSLMRENPAFGTYYYQSIAQKLDALQARRDTQELQSLMTARVRQAFIHPPNWIEATDSIREAVSVMKRERVNALLVRLEEKAGIVTALSLSDAVILRGEPVETPVGGIATWDLVSIGANEFLFNALVLMTRHGLRRLVVRDGRTIVGLLEEVDVLGFLSNHSHIIALQVTRAENQEDLKHATQDLVRLIEVLHGNGVRVQFIAQAVAELADQIFAKLLRQIAPPALADNSCLIVMGSEGRREQIMKTDQDNGLILRDGLEGTELERVRREFTAALIEFGYPRCPAEIMVANPAWSKPLSAFREDLRRWVLSPDAAGLRNLAVFYDALPAAGDRTLLDEAKGYMFDLIDGNEAFCHHFAQAIDAFETPISRFHRLLVGAGSQGDALDIKRGGLFPIVHGVRSLALERRLFETNSMERIRRLQDLGALDRAVADDLVQALSFFMDLRLRTQLGHKGKESSDTLIAPERLTTLERDLLKDSFLVVKRFKEQIRHHFRLSRL